LPNLRVLATSCVRLELRSLPSTGVTRLQQYYEPLRHPRAPGLSVTGVRLIIPDLRLGASRVARAFLVYMLSPLPRHSDWEHCFARSPQPYQPSPVWQPGRPAHRPFRGLLGVHSRCGLHTRAATKSWLALPEGFSHFVTSMTAPVASGWSVRRVALAPTGKAPPYHGARHIRTLVLLTRQSCCHQEGAD
jgi:hypothetical protein